VSQSSCRLGQCLLCPLCPALGGFSGVLKGGNATTFAFYWQLPDAQFVYDDGLKFFSGGDFGLESGRPVPLPYPTVATG
jgi:hypothetical protein